MSDVATSVTVDFGSTFTKVRAVGPGVEILGATQHRTTIDSDVLDGMREALRLLEEQGVDYSEEKLSACSSAGGGLWMGVVGLIEDLTAEAARQAALGAGARTLQVVSGGLGGVESARHLLGQNPDIVLLVGGTDGGDRDSLIDSATALADAEAMVPVVLSGNDEAQPEAERILVEADVPCVSTANVMPEVGRLNPAPAREAIRELFISHVIGGKLGGSSETLVKLVRMATPDAALRGVEILASILDEEGRPGGVIAVDIGGATTDVHSWVPDLARSGSHRPLLPQSNAARTVEADLGMRWNAPGIIEAASSEGILPVEGREVLKEAADMRSEDPGFLPSDERESEIERELARMAIAIALRRHSGSRRVSLTQDGAVLTQDGRDLSEVPILIALGGVLHGMEESDLEDCLRLAHEGREERLLPESIQIGMDHRGVITAAGLLSESDLTASRQLLKTELSEFFSVSPRH